MGLVAVLLLAVALSLDTFAVAVSIGMCRSKLPTYYKFRYLTIIGLFHFIMPVVGSFRIYDGRALRSLDFFCFALFPGNKNDIRGLGEKG